MKDKDYIEGLKRGLKSRENWLSGSTNYRDIESMFYLLIKPFLEKGSEHKSKNKTEGAKRAVEMFALACYAQNERIDHWRGIDSETLLDPNLSGRTPDFLINNLRYVEVYTPVMGPTEKQLALIHQEGFVESPRLANSNVIRTLNRKSAKYKDIDISFLVHTVSQGFTKEITDSIKQVRLHSNRHSIVYYHGTELVIKKSG